MQLLIQWKDQDNSIQLIPFMIRTGIESDKRGLNDRVSIGNPNGMGN